MKKRSFVQTLVIGAGYVAAIILGVFLYISNRELAWTKGNLDAAYDQIDRDYRDMKDLELTNTEMKFQVDSLYIVTNLQGIELRHWEERGR